jgi:uncharacterized protein (DUF1697 family)
MAPLRVELEKAGFKNVRTYIQSGNIVAASSLSQSELEKLVHNIIKENFGGDIKVLARTVNQFRDIIARNPFKNADTSKLYFTFLAAKPDDVLIREFLAQGYSPDQVEIIDDTVYVLCATRYSDLKANNNFIERKLKVASTTRIYNTVVKLAELGTE